MISNETLTQRPVPSSGELLPAIGLGTWKTFDVGGDTAQREALATVLRRFVEVGGSLVDSSPMYGSAEEVVGALAEKLRLRDRLFLATKVWTEGEGRGVEEIERSFRRFRATTLDLLQVHNLVDLATQLPTLRRLKAAGRVRYVGVTHYHRRAHSEVAKVLRHESLDFLQINYSPFEPEAERELLPLAAERGIAVIVNRPFAGGALRRLTPLRLPEVARQLGASSWAQLALLWILGHPAVTCVIPATADPAHVVDNLEAARLPLPDEAQRRAIARAMA
jgi:diketogulonate reductase-like aldo/keto reductase